MKPNISDDSILTENFTTSQRTDRPDRPEGGVLIYAKESLSLKHHCVLAIRGLEAVCVELRVKGKTLLLGGFYRQPNSNNNYFDLIEESFDRAFNTITTDIFITGDFN